MEMRNKYSCLLCATAVSKMSGLDHETKPRKGGAQREKEGEKGGIFVDTCQLSGGQSTWLILGSPAGVGTW